MANILQNELVQGLNHNYLPFYVLSEIGKTKAVGPLSWGIARTQILEQAAQIAIKTGDRKLDLSIEKFSPY